MAVKNTTLFVNTIISNYMFRPNSAIFRLEYSVRGKLSVWSKRRCAGEGTRSRLQIWGQWLKWCWHKCVSAWWVHLLVGWPAGLVLEAWWPGVGSNSFEMATVRGLQPSGHLKTTTSDTGPPCLKNQPRGLTDQQMNSPSGHTLVPTPFQPLTPYL